MKPTNKELAIQMVGHKERQKGYGTPRGYGCPFLSDCKCEDACGVVYPSTKDGYGLVIGCTCTKLTKKYMIRRLDWFIKKYLTSA